MIIKRDVGMSKRQVYHQRKINVKPGTLQQMHYLYVGCFCMVIVACYYVFVLDYSLEQDIQVDEIPVQKSDEQNTNDTGK